MATYLGFLQRAEDGEEFVAPVEAGSRAEAGKALAKTYPTAGYRVLTIYARDELENVLTNLTRWPGLPSKPQPSLDERLARVRTGTQLPPLLRPKATPLPQADGATLQAQNLQTIRELVSRTDSPELKQMAARLLAGGLLADGHADTLTQLATQPTQPTVLQATRMAPAATAAPAAKPARQPVPPAPSLSARLQAPASPAMSAVAQQRPSLISVLKQMRG